MVDGGDVVVLKPNGIGADKDDFPREIIRGNLPGQQVRHGDGLVKIPRLAAEGHIPEIPGVHRGQGHRAKVIVVVVHLGQCQGHGGVLRPVGQAQLQHMVAQNAVGVQHGVDVALHRHVPQGGIGLLKG